MHHFPHFANIYLPFLSLLIWQYDVLGLSFQSHCLSAILLDDNNERFWQANRHTHSWVYAFLQRLEKAIGGRTILSPRCLMQQQQHHNTHNLQQFYTEATCNYQYTPAISTSVTTTATAAGQMMITNDNAKKKNSNNYLGSFLHASDGYLLAHLLLQRQEEVCSLANRHVEMLQRPMNVMLLARSETRNLLNQPAILTTLRDFMTSTHTPLRFATRSNHTIHFPETIPSTAASDKGEGVTGGVYFEGLDFAQQALALHESDLVLTVHGAAETNLIFLKPCSILLEITPFGFDVDFFDVFAAESEVLHYGWQEDFVHTVHSQSFRLRPQCAAILQDMRDTATVVMETKNTTTATINTRRGLSAEKRKEEEEQGWELLEGTNNEALTGRSRNHRRQLLAKKKSNKYLAPGDNSNSRPMRLFPEYNAVYSERCLQDPLCRSCTREADGVMVSLDKLLHVLEIAIADRKQCIQRHPFYNPHHFHQQHSGQ